MSVAQRRQEAVRVRSAFNADPFDPASWLDTTATFMESGYYGAAYHLASRLVETHPSPDALCNLAASQMWLALHAQSDEWLLAAKDAILAAITADPEHHAAQNQLALVLFELGDYAVAETQARQRLEVQPGDPHLARVLAHCCFARGAWADGFDAYALTVGQKTREIHWRAHGLVPWKGEPKTKLLVMGEQGIGDEISFASMVPDAAKRNDVTLICDRRLEGLFSRSFPNVRVEGSRFDPARTGWTPRTPVFGGFDGINFTPPPPATEPPPANDSFVLAGGLGSVYRRSAGAFPRLPFLQADPVRREAIRARLDALPGRKIGIAWTGGTPPAYLYRRWLPEAELLSLLDVTDVSWISLEYREPFALPPGVHHWPDIVEAKNYDEVAALVAELDCVVTVTTAVAHLCGALGVTAHVLVPECPRWFYGIAGKASAWYSSLLLHRQYREDGELRWPIDEVKAAL